MLIQVVRVVRIKKMGLRCGNCPRPYKKTKTHFLYQWGTLQPPSPKARHLPAVYHRKGSPLRGPWAPYAKQTANTPKGISNYILSCTHKRTKAIPRNSK